MNNWVVLTYRISDLIFCITTFDSTSKLKIILKRVGIDVATITGWIIGFERRLWQAHYRNIRKTVWLDETHYRFFPGLMLGIDRWNARDIDLILQTRSTDIFITTLERIRIENAPCALKLADVDIIVCQHVHRCTSNADPDRDQNLPDPQSIRWYRYYQNRRNIRNPGIEVATGCLTTRGMHLLNCTHCVTNASPSVPGAVSIPCAIGSKSTVFLESARDHQFAGTVDPFPGGESACYYRNVHPFQTARCIEFEDKHVWVYSVFAADAPCLVGIKSRSLLWVAAYIDVNTPGSRLNVKTWSSLIPPSSTQIKSPSAVLIQAVKTS